MRKTILTLAALLAALAASIAAPSARADCITDATVTYVGNDWGPTPMWRVSVPSLNETLDVQAADADAARAAVAPFVTCPAAPAPAPVAPPVATDPTATAPTTTTPTDTTSTATTPASSGPSDSAINAATIILADADVTYVGDSWGPLPIWRVHVPSRNATYDVAAATAADARSAVLGPLAASIDSNPTVTAAAPAQTVSAAEGPAAAAAQAGTAIAVAVPVAPAPAVVKVTPAKSPYARKGVHQAPATAKRVPR